ncbi:hypothetical protein MJ699_26465 [Klebsiella pneumoniae]|nr:hypothetical protein MJ699_26465 [Klebsiella pneumoniae]
MPGLSLFSELVKSCLAQPGLTTGQLLEQYRGTKRGGQPLKNCRCGTI